MLPLAFAWLCSAAFVASLGFFLYAYLFEFKAPVPADASAGLPILINFLLFSAFALHHSLFARTSLKSRVSAAVSPALERAFYTLVSSVIFILVCWAWQPVPGTAWVLSGPWQALGYGAVLAGIIVTGISARALDVLDLAGVRQVLRARGGAGAGHTPLKTDGLYGFVRHPVYFGWVLLVFGVPAMTMTRLTFAVVSTLYLAIAIPFEERGLTETFGPEYASYQRKVRWRMIPGLY